MLQRFLSALRSLAFASLAISVLSLLSGCGESSTTTVNGTVTYKDKAVESGTVTLFAKESGAAFTGTIQPDGSFTIENVPEGSVQIGVSSPNPNPERPADRRGAGENPNTMNSRARGVPGAPAAPAPAASTAPAGKWVPIPEGYLDPANSGLTGTVKSGQTLKVEMK